MQFALAATTKVKDYTDQAADSTVRDAVKEQIKSEIYGS